eukprot:symbB.v1.2.027922.t1/scaffold2891.1/size67802/4
MAMRAMVLVGNGIVDATRWATTAIRWLGIRWAVVRTRSGKATNGRVRCARRLGDKTAMETAQPPATEMITKIATTTTGTLRFKHQVHASGNKQLGLMPEHAVHKLEQPNVTHIQTSPPSAFALSRPDGLEREKRPYRSRREGSRLPFLLLLDTV